MLDDYLSRAFDYTSLAVALDIVPPPVPKMDLRGAATLAQQISKVVPFSPENSFSDAIKGLSLYGGKLIRPDGIATCQASQT